MCAITGVYAPDGKAALYARELLHFQQNRGQDASGIFTFSPSNNGQMFWKKGHGLVYQVFSDDFTLVPEKVRGNVTWTRDMQGQFATGHDRYRTIGVGGPDNAQPFMTKNERYTVVMAHNGHVNNYEDVAAQLDLEQRMKSDPTVGGLITDERLNGRSDCDVIPLLYIFADGLMKRKDTIDGILQGAEDAMRMIRGAFTVTATVYDSETRGTYQVAFKDPRGIRPGFFGYERDANAFAVCSETYALEKMRFWDIKPIKNGEVVIFGDKGVHRQQLPAFRMYQYLPCGFEPDYFSRGLSVLDGRSVNHTRYLFGRTLGRKLKKEKAEWLSLADFVVPVPFTPIPIAKGVADELQNLSILFRICIEKDRFNYRREFITDPLERHKKKVDIHWDAVTGSTILLIEDSIIRGDTTSNVIQQLREAGVKGVYVLSSYPRVTHRCDLGIDMRTHQELIANGKSDAEIAHKIGADGVMYLTLQEYDESLDRTEVDAGLKRKIEKGIFSPEILEFVSNGQRCNACVTGKNPTHD